MYLDLTSMDTPAHTHTPPDTGDRLTKWRLLLGQQSDPTNSIAMSDAQSGMDDVLEALYDSDRRGGLGSSAPNINKWLGDIRRYFPQSVVQLIQKDAIERLGLQELLLEPELLQEVEPDVHLVGTLLSLKDALPEQTRDTARAVVQQVADDLQQRLRDKMRQALAGSLDRARRNRRPRHTEINWHATIRRNLKHYQPDYRSVVPEQLVGYGRRGSDLKHIILAVDQSGSMAGSVVYAGIYGAVMASIRAIKMSFVAFDTAVADLTDTLSEPVDLLFGIQLGGGTDINHALTYVETLVERPTDTVVVLISDLYEGGSVAGLMQRIESLVRSGVKLVPLLALSDEGSPAYDTQIAAYLADLDIPAFACTPDAFPEVMARAING